MDWPEIWCLMEVSTMFYILQILHFYLVGQFDRTMHSTSECPVNSSKMFVLNITIWDLCKLIRQAWEVDIFRLHLVIDSLHECLHVIFPPCPERFLPSHITQSRRLVRMLLNSTGHYLVTTGHHWSVILGIKNMKIDEEQYCNCVGL